MAKWNWTQSQEEVVILINTPLISGPSDVDVDFTESSVSVSVSLPSGSELSFDFDPVAHAVEPDLCSWALSNDRAAVEITLRKREIGRSWQTLEAGDSDSENTSSPAGTSARPPSGSARPPSDSLSLQVMSDLHLEFHFRTPPRGSKQGYYVFQPPVSAPNLALLGDIGLVQHDGLFSFLEEQLRRFDRVFYLLGNHEFYGRSATYDETVRKVEAFAERMRMQRAAAATGTGKQGEFVFLNRTRYDVPGSQVSILGCTLWSHVPPEAAQAVQAGLNDFKEISGWSLERHVQAHAEDVAWLSAQLAQLRGRRAVVLTHHAPTLIGTSDRKHAGSPASAGFATELSGRADLWDHGPTVWAFGHTHHCCDFELNGVRVYSNQRGYEGDEAKQSGFKPDAVIHV